MLLLHALPAQDTKPASGTALVIKTTQEEVAERVADMFAFEGKDLPTLADGACWVLTVDTAGKLAATTEKGSAPYLQVRAKPNALLEIFGEQVQQAQESVSMIAGFAAGQMGTSPAELNKLVEGVFAFPKQIDELNVDVSGSETSGFDGRVELRPTGDGWLAGFVSDLKPNPKGAPQLPQESALMRLRTNVSSDALAKAAKPFLPIVVGGGAASKEERGTFAQVVNDAMAQFDGTLAMAMNSEAAQTMLVGLQDAAKMNTLMESEGFQAWRKASTEANPQATVETVPKALQHRDVAMTKTSSEVTTPMGEQTTTVFSGIAGSYLVMAGSEAAAKTVVDAVLDDEVKRSALSGDALLTLQMSLAEMVGVMSQGMADTEGAPNSVDLSLAKKDSSLLLTFKVGM